jgi:hypothetical protein
LEVIQKEDLLLAGEPYRNFVCSVKSTFTRDSYTKALRQFMTFRNISTCDDLIKGESKLLQTSIIEWLVHLKEVKKLSSALITLYCAALHHFYDMKAVMAYNFIKPCIFNE